MKIDRITTAAENDRKNMVNLHARGFFAASSALSALLVVKVRNIFDGETASILGYASAAGSHIGTPALARQFRVAGGPSPRSLVGLLSVFAGPSLHFGAMPGRILGPATASGGGLKPRSCSKPSFGSDNRALDANAVCHELLVLVTVLARRASRVVTQAIGAGCYPVLVLRTFSLARHSVLNGARSAVPADCVPFRQVTVSAWFAGMVEALACRLRGLSLWNSVHRSPTLSATFTVVQAA